MSETRRGKERTMCAEDKREVMEDIYYMAVR